MQFIDFLLTQYQVLKKAEVKNISSVCTHSQKVKKNSLFVAIKGQKTDGHNYLKQAIQKGAGALLVKNSQNIPRHFKGWIFKYRGLPGLALLLNEFYNFPSKKLFTIGVTGTNGKTSFCYLLEHIYQSCGWPTAVIGTVNQRFGKYKWPAPLTTPDPVELFNRLNDFVKKGAKAVVMELSSHALHQHRAKGVSFKALVFTNFSQDHLDYHKTMDNYFKAKKSLFLKACYQEDKNLFCLLNHDDKKGLELKNRIQKPCWTFGKNPKADFFFKIKKQLSGKSVFDVKHQSKSSQYALAWPGEHNVYNAVSALACAQLTGFKAKDCAKALKSFKAPPGRLEHISQKPFSIFLDYAHSPTALKSALLALKSSLLDSKSKGGEIILVFGCGGDRDKSKRPKMAKLALKLADKVFLTSDNPRSENPQHIINHCLKGLREDEKTKLTIELDRKTAIQKALKFAKKGDQVLIAGKGHEPFQIIGSKKIPFSDKTVALNSLKEL